MSDKLKPCPFCGGEAKLHEAYDIEGNHAVWRILCTECNMVTAYYNTPDCVVDAWNRRSNDE